MNNSRRVVLYFLAQCIFYIASSLVHPITPTLIVERGFNAYMFGVSLAAMKIMYFLFSPFWGRLCGILSSRTVIAISCIGYAIGQIGFCYAPTEGLVIAARMFGGVFAGGFFTAVLNYTINTADEERLGRYLILQSTLQSVVSAAGYFIGGMLGLISTEAPFLAQTAALLLAAVIFLRICGNDTAGKQEKPSPARLLREANPFAAFAACRSFVTPLFVVLFAAVALASVGQDAVDQCFNYYLRDQFQLTSAYNGIFKAIIAIISLAANATICVWLIRKTDIRRTVVPITLLSALSILPLLLFDTIVPFVTGYVLFFAFNAIRMPMVQSLGAKMGHGSNSNLAMGLFTSMASLGGIFGALFAGLIYAQGAKLPFLLAFVALLLAGVCSAIYSIALRKRDRGAL